MSVDLGDDELLLRYACHSRDHITFLIRGTKRQALTDFGSTARHRLKAPKGDRAGSHSVRVNDQWRIVFRWTTDGPADVEIVDYH